MALKTLTHDLMVFKRSVETEHARPASAAADNCLTFGAKY
ncbi:MAG: hypothetical protein JWL69_2724 [Phycisphaerales bacterium]|jgi:hypothetical protein|nr:hypothetical protein [Phycisphaerales bacterium]